MTAMWSASLRHFFPMTFCGYYVLHAYIQAFICGLPLIVMLNSALMDRVLPAGLQGLCI